MTEKKKYEELTFTDDFMFGAVLISNPDLCRELLELILEVEIIKITPPEPQKDIENGYDVRGIRLDIYVNDDAGTVYNLEMQTTVKSSLPKRMRYYQGMIDMNLIKRGAKYEDLKESYVIFLCTGDPFGKRLPIYRFENLCIQDTDIKLTDSAIKIVINPDSEREGLSEEMNEFLNLLQGKAVKTGLAKKLSDAVEETKERGERRGAYMDMIQKLQEEHDEGYGEGVNTTIEMLLKSGMSVKEIHDRTNLDIARIKKIEESLLVEA